MVISVIVEIGKTYGIWYEFVGRIKTKVLKLKTSERQRMHL